MSVNVFKELYFVHRRTDIQEGKRITYAECPPKLRSRLHARTSYHIVFQPGTWETSEPSSARLTTTLARVLWLTPPPVRPSVQSRPMPAPHHFFGEPEVDRCDARVPLDRVLLQPPAQCVVMSRKGLGGPADLSHKGIRPETEAGRCETRRLPPWDRVGRT